MKESKRGNEHRKQAYGAGMKITQFIVDESFIAPGPFESFRGLGGSQTNCYQ